MPARRLILLAVVALLLIFNLWHFNHARRTPGVAPAATPDTTTIADGMWNDYQQAASLRDGTDQQFQAVLNKLQRDRDSVPNRNLKSNADLLADLRGCTTWLLFYRQTVNKPNPDPSWRERSLEHIQSCSKSHADIAH